MDCSDSRSRRVSERGRNRKRIPLVLVDPLHLHSIRPRALVFGVFRKGATTSFPQPALQLPTTLTSAFFCFANSRYEFTRWLVWRTQPIVYNTYRVERKICPWPSETNSILFFRFDGNMCKKPVAEKLILILTFKINIFFLALYFTHHKGKTLWWVEFKVEINFEAAFLHIYFHEIKGIEFIFNSQINKLCLYLS